MNIDKRNPVINWYTYKGKEYLKFTFNEKLKYSEAVLAIKEWEVFFKEKENDKITLIWECTHMVDYEPLARGAWQAAIKNLKPQINSIWLISNSKLIKAGAMLLSMFTSFSISVVANESEISEENLVVL